mgnify:CR=1 FL=1
MVIVEIQPQSDWTLAITANNGRMGYFDVKPYLDYEAFEELREHSEFLKISNGGYFVEWECCADLSADTIEAGWHIQNSPRQAA